MTFVVVALVQDFDKSVVEQVTVVLYVVELGAGAGVGDSSVTGAGDTAEGSNSVFNDVFHL